MYAAVFFLKKIKCAAVRVNAHTAKIPKLDSPPTWGESSSFGIYARMWPS